MSEKISKQVGEEVPDLAILETHVGKVAINVEQPVIAAQKIEVHVV